MKGVFESMETLEFDRENSVIIKNSDFSQINIDLGNTTENIKSAAPKIEQDIQTIPVPQNENLNPEEKQKFENIHISEVQDCKFQTLDESYSDTFVKYYINDRKEISSEY